MRSRSSPAPSKRSARTHAREFGDDVRYRINIDNDGDGDADIIYEFAFQTEVAQPELVPLQQRPDRLDRQRELEPQAVLLGHPDQPRTGARCSARGLACPPCNIGPLSTPNYDLLASQAIHSLPGGRHRVRRAAARGLLRRPRLDLRPGRPAAVREPAHVGGDRWRPPPASTARNNFSVHSIALKVPKSDLTRDGTTPTDAIVAESVVGVWASASRQAATVREPWSGTSHEAGDWMQVSRLGNPLFNEVLVGMGFKDLWNSLPPSADERFAAGVQHPGARDAAAGAVPGRVPEPGQAHRRRAPTSSRSS